MSALLSVLETHPGGLSKSAIGRVAGVPDRRWQVIGQVSFGASWDWYTDLDGQPGEE